MRGVDVSDLDEATVAESDELGIAGNADIAGGVVVTDTNGTPLPTTNEPCLPERDPDPPDGPFEPSTGEPIDHRWFSGWVHPDELARRRDLNRRSRQQYDPPANTAT